MNFFKKKAFSFENDNAIGGELVLPVISATVNQAAILDSSSEFSLMATQIANPLVSATQFASAGTSSSPSTGGNNVQEMTGVASTPGFFSVNTSAAAVSQWRIDSKGNVNEGDGYMSFTISRSGNVESAATIRVATAGGTATAGLDYQSLNQTLSFAANETSKTVKVAVINDAIVESSENVKVTISNPSSGTITLAQATGVIQDNDKSITPAKWSVVSLGDADENSGYLNFVVKREGGDINASASVKVQTKGGTATAVDCKIMGVSRDTVNRYQ